MIDIHRIPAAVKCSAFDSIARLIFSGLGAVNEIAVHATVCVHANADGYAFPGFARIGQLTGIKDKRTLTKAISGIEQKGHLEVARARGQHVQPHRQVVGPDELVVQAPGFRPCSKQIGDLVGVHGAAA